MHAELGDWVAAVDGYREAYETRSALRAAAGVTGRRRVVYNDLAHLLEALAATEAWADIEVLLPATLDDVGEIGSARTRRVLRRVVRRAARAKWRRRRSRTRSRRLRPSSIARRRRGERVIFGPR